MKYFISGIILAGGINSRFAGKNKAFVDIDGKSVIKTVHSLFSELFHEVILVTNEPEKYADMDLKIVSDIFPVSSSLRGIHSGLFYAGFPFAFITACDMPFLKKKLIKAIINEIESKVDIVIPETSAGFEPLCAAYSKRCLPVIEQRLNTEDLSIRGIIDRVKTKRIPEKTLREYDKELLSFFNINSPRELEKARRIISINNGKR